MAEAIKDGTGAGYLAHVNKDNQLVTRAISVQQRLKSALDSNYYEVDTGQITLSNATETGIIYIKNTITTGKLLVIDRIFYDAWVSTGGDNGGGILKYYLNPTITGGSAIVPVNQNAGSPAAATGTFSKSLTTISGTAYATTFFAELSSNAYEEGRIVIPSQRSFAVTLTAPTSNTSMKVAASVAFYYLDEELV